MRGVALDEGRQLGERSKRAEVNRANASRGRCNHGREEAEDVSINRHHEHVCLLEHFALGRGDAVFAENPGVEL